ncbi:hypothetical protein F2Q69_00006303 [Brassica cretica]|uniref:Uncharacterized protein n=1 Tax=Brassica cretica TaxID=69181 RepID=A0A8S9PEZ0_BRACR|nr:hypothetical protein F2Q69_00006303 [Brassica cretica]
MKKKMKSLKDRKTQEFIKALSRPPGSCIRSKDLALECDRCRTLTKAKDLPLTPIKTTYFKTE